MIIGSEIIRFEELSSTNSHAALLIRQGAVPEGTVVYSSFQTTGRGQPGNKWVSEKGKNLLFSIILYPVSIPAEDQFLISIAISLGICDFIDRETRHCTIKWPNDIYLKDDKIAGILIECSVMGNTLGSCIAGIGININQEKFPGEIENPVSLKIATGAEYDTGECLRQLLSDLDTRYRELLYGDRNKLRNCYTSRLYRLNELQVFRGCGTTFKAKITGITRSGLLETTREDGEKETHRFKEIEYLRRPFSSP